MLTFFLYLLPLFGTVFCHVFYRKYIDRDKTTNFIPRLVRIVLSMFCFVPVIGWLTFGIWIYVFCDKGTKFIPNKLTNYFINN